jgi:hypothetical protein
LPEPKKGRPVKVTIEKTLFGGYSLRVDGRNGIVKVRRIE